MIERGEKNKDESPRTNTRRLLRGVKYNFPSQNRTDRIRRSLEFHFVLTKSIEAKYKKGSRQLKQALPNVLSSNILCKYKFLNRAKKDVGLKTAREKVQFNA
jgi:hypothetical protein